MKILVVDGSTDGCERVVRALGRDDHLVKAARSVQDADRVLGQGPVDVVVLDPVLPDEDGVSWCRRVRRAGFQEMILVLTVDRDVTRRLEVFEAGADGFLAKDHAPGERVVDPVEQFLTYSVEHGLSLWHGMAGWAGQELRFVRWAERYGIALDVCIDADLDAELHPDTARTLLDGRRLLLSVGHDEYWTWGMRDTIERFVAGGGNVAFLSGNTAYWQVRLEHDDRRMVAWKPIGSSWPSSPVQM